MFKRVTIFTRNWDCFSLLSLSKIFLDLATLEAGLTTLLILIINSNA